MRKIVVTLIGSVLGLFGCGRPQIALDFSTPEGAILMLEAACKAKDLEAAVRAKDFAAEARLMLAGMKGGMEHDGDVVKQTAETLELAFRAELSAGFPDFSGLKSEFIGREKVDADQEVVLVTERFTYPDRRVAVQKLLVARVGSEWRVLNVQQ